MSLEKFVEKNFSLPSPNPLRKLEAAIVAEAYALCGVDWDKEDYGPSGTPRRLQTWGFKKSGVAGWSKMECLLARLELARRAQKRCKYKELVGRK